MDANCGKNVELDLIINPTDQTPLVRYSAGNSKFEIIGRSIPEDVAGFYEPVMRWLKTLKSTKPSRLNAEFILDYFNSNSSRMLLEILKDFEKMKETGALIEVEWYYEDDDEDMLEFGNDLVDIIKVPIEVIPLPATIFDQRKASLLTT